MAWITAIGSDPAQVDYRLGLGHGCVGEGVNDRQLDYHTDLREEPLIWVGKALADLGIEAGTELKPEDFDKARALANGYNPTTGEQLVKHKKAVPRDAKLPVAQLVRMIDGVAQEAGVPVNEVLISTRTRKMYERAVRAVDREGETAAMRADHAGRLADAAGLTPDEVWGEDTFTASVSRLTKTVIRPDGTQETVDNRITAGNLIYDATLTLDGGFDAANALFDAKTRAELKAIFTEQATNTFAWLEGITAYGMRGHHGDGQTADITPGNGFAGWAMFHRQSRPVDGASIGDPHWHVHYVIANMTRGADGKWSTIAAGGRDLMRHAPVVDRLTQAAVRDVLARRYGAQFRKSERTGRWELAAISDEAILLFSKRGQSIDAALVEMGFTPEEATAALRRVAAAQTRERKGEGTTASDQTLVEHWQAEARDAGIDPEQVNRDFHAGVGILPPQPRPPLTELATLLQDTKSGLTSHTRRFSRIDAMAAVADALPAGISHGELEQLTDDVLEQAGFVQLRRAATGVQPTNGERHQLGASHMANAELYTTQDLIDCEKIIVNVAEASHDDQTTIRVPRATAEMAATAIEVGGGFELSAEQRRELLRITTSGKALDALIGPPGSGKTTLMDAVRAAYQTSGLVIAGTATQGVTAQTLQAESGIPSRTVAQWLARIDNGPGLRGVDVLIMDESGMIDDRARARLYIEAARTGTKIVEIGDPKQLRGVGAGSSFAVVHALVEGGALTQNRRQAETDERAALAAWRQGEYSEALTSWADRDRLVVTETGPEATAAMLASWIDQRQGAPDEFTEQRGLLMVAAANEMVDRLNEGAQALRAVAGELGDARTYHLPGAKTTSFCEGDYVLVRVTERSKDGGPDVFNGYRGVIDAINPDGSVAVRWERATSDGRVIESKVLAPEFIAKGGLTLGYAITIHKSQGLTVGSDGATWTGPDGERRGGAVLFHALGADNPGEYVASSRHKLKLWMFLARKDIESSQDDYLLGRPRSMWERTRRVITKLVDRAKATEVNRNDTPVLVDLGLLDDPFPSRRPASAPDATRTGPSPEELAQRQAQRAKRRAAEIVRLAKAEAWLHAEWGEHPAVDQVVRGAAFPTIARLLDRADHAGNNPRDLLRGLNPDTMIGAQVRDPSRLAAWLVKKTAHEDPAVLRARPRPMTKAQRQARAAAAEQSQRDAAGRLLREVWGEHPAVERVLQETAMGAVAQNLATASRAGVDPRAILRGIDPDVVIRPHINNPAAFTAARIRAAATAPPPTDPATTAGPQSRPTETPLPPEAPVRLDVLVPAYERTAARLAARPTPVPVGNIPETRAVATRQGPAQPGAERPATSPPRRDALWPDWLPIPPSPEILTGQDRAIARASATDAARIRARVVELGREAAGTRPDWVEQLGPAPDGAANRARYLAGLATIAAYREQYQITDADPLGPPPPIGQPQRAYQAAQRAREQVERAAGPRLQQPPGTGPGERTGPQQKPAATPSADKTRPSDEHVEQARQRAQRLIEQQRRAQRERMNQDPRRPGPGQGQGPRPGY